MLRFWVHYLMYQERCRWKDGVGVNLHAVCLCVCRIVIRNHRRNFLRARAPSKYLQPIYVRETDEIAAPRQTTVSGLYVAGSHVSGQKACILTL